MRNFFFILWIGLYFFLNSLSMTWAQQIRSNDVEVVIQGKRYKSIRDYRRKQLKSALKEALSSRNLREFDKDEVYQIIREIYKEPPVDKSPKEALKPMEQESIEPAKGGQTAGKNARDLSVVQMREMLESYIDEHNDVEPLFLDSDKVKSIIIEPQE